MKKLLITGWFASALFLVLHGLQALPANAQSGPATNEEFCADANGDGEVDLSDAVTILTYRFTDESKAPYCVLAEVSIDDLTARIVELDTGLATCQAILAGAETQLSSCQADLLTSEAQVVTASGTLYRSS